jgi:hypothetical protein
LYNFV